MCQQIVGILVIVFLSHRCQAVCDEYNFNVRIQIRIYSGFFFVANMNTNISGSNFFYEYRYIRVTKDGQI